MNNTNTINTYAQNQLIDLSNKVYSILRNKYEQLPYGTLFEEFAYTGKFDAINRYNYHTHGFIIMRLNSGNV